MTGRANATNTGSPGLVAWAVMLSLVIVYMYGLGLLERISEHWLLFVPLALVGAMISGQFCAGLGIPELFHDDPDNSASRPAPS